MPEASRSPRFVRRTRVRLSLAVEADVLTMQRYRALDLAVETKADLTPVTEADRAVEQALRGRIARERGEAVAGEEFGVEEADVRWWLDPIDGTKQYARGLPDLGDADRARARRRDRRRRRVGARARSPLVGGARRRRVPRRLADPRLAASRDSRTRTSRRRACAASRSSPSLRTASPSRAPTPTSGSTSSSPRDGSRPPATR